MKSKGFILLVVIFCALNSFGGSIGSPSKRRVKSRHGALVRLNYMFSPAASNAGAEVIMIHSLRLVRSRYSGFTGFGYQFYNTNHHVAYLNFESLIYNSDLKNSFCLGFSPRYHFQDKGLFSLKQELSYMYFVDEKKLSPISGYNISLGYEFPIEGEMRISPYSIGVKMFFKASRYGYKRRRNAIKHREKEEEESKKSLGEIED